MSENIKVIQTAKQGADRVESFAYEAVTLFKNKLHLNMKPFDKAAQTKITGLMTKNKKDCDFCGSFDGDTVKCFARVGTDRINTETDPKGQAKLSDYGPSGVDDRNEILDALVMWGIATKSQADAVRKKPIKV
jgi:hypothetical protein